MKDEHIRTDATDDQAIKVSIPATAGTTFVVVDASGQILSATPTVADLLDHTDAPLVGEFLDNLITFCRCDTEEPLPGFLARAVFDESWDLPFDLDFYSVSGRRYQVTEIVPEYVGKRLLNLSLYFETLVSYEIELTEDRELLEATARMANVGGWELDCESDCVRWTDQTFRIHELDPGETLDLEDALAFYSAASRAILDPAVQRATETGEPYDLELEIVTSKGKVRTTQTICQPVIVDGVVVKLRGTCQDITQRKETEKALQESETRFRDIFDNSTAIRLLIDPVTGVIVEANATAVAFYGRSVDAIRNLTVFEIDTRPRSEVERDLKTASGGHRSEFEFRDRLESGEIRDMKVDTGPAPVNGKMLVHSRVTDVTRQKPEEANNFRMQQLESLGTLAGGIAHDFNNVLTTIFGNVSVARELLTSDHVATSYLKNAEGAIDRATRLSRQLLTFAKGGVPVLEVVNLSQLIAEVTILDLSVRNVIPDFQIEPDLKNVLVDRGQLQQVFSNLVVNAADAMPEGGRICLSATNRLLAGDEIPGIAAGSYVQVTIRDEGEGISPHDSKRIFAPYFTTKPHGTGLGLATCYSIIKRHGGHIDLVSEVGAGTTAKILLPASATSGNDGSSPVAAEKDSVQESKRVLIMDDEVLILDVASGILRASGALVETCENPDAVVAAYLSAFEQQQPYDVVILDLTIRGGAGGEVAARRILEIDSDAIIICSSGYTDADVVSEFRRFGFEGIIKKPYTAADLREVVGRFPARRKLS